MPGGAKHRMVMRAACVGVLLLGILFPLTGCAVKSARVALTGEDGQNWPTYRAGLSARGRVEHDRPLRIETLLWESKSGGVATHEPVVYRGLLFHTGQDRRLEIFDAATGHRKFRDRYDGPVTGSVATDTGFVFATDQEQRELYYFHYDPLKKLSLIHISEPTRPY
mgnify:CR=1 FL=1